MEPTLEWTHGLKLTVFFSAYSFIGLEFRSGLLLAEGLEGNWPVDLRVQRPAALAEEQLVGLRVQRPGLTFEWPTA